MASGISFSENGFEYDWNKAATGVMLGTMVGAVSGGVGMGIGSLTSLTSESMLYRGCMAVTDGILGLSSYFAQHAIDNTMDKISVGGAFISAFGGLFNFASPLNKYFDALWSPIMATELAFGYDIFTYALKNQKRGK